jgi:D-alanyl-D-alanine carboxypeptidase/D-alanyl-D-alanine-endopeptidase (penicillin-binding protein 4)
VHGVAGYVEGAGGKRWVLVVIANHPQAAAMQGAIDALVAWTAQGE